MPFQPQQVGPRSAFNCLCNLLFAVFSPPFTAFVGGAAGPRGCAAVRELRDANRCRQTPRRSPVRIATALTHAAAHGSAATFSLSTASHQCPSRRRRRRRRWLWLCRWLPPSLFQRPSAAVSACHSQTSSVYLCSMAIEAVEAAGRREEASGRREAELRAQLEQLKAKSVTRVQVISS